jgi:glycosyltransferase involved in cell wall biosynthesis
VNDVGGTPEVSVVMPCLNEADTLATCVDKAHAALRSAGIHGEVVVADNGSSDGSQDIARTRGARVVDVPTKGYGSALMGGIDAAKGRFVIMGDADDSYDFGEIPKFVAKLREGTSWFRAVAFRAEGGRSARERCLSCIGGSETLGSPFWCAPGFARP